MSRGFGGGVPAVLGVAMMLGAACLMPSAAFAQGQGSASVKKLVAKGSAATKVSNRSRSNTGSTQAAAPAKPALVGSYGDWGTYVSQSAKSKVCYALGQPKARTPASLKRDGAYIFISNRPGEGVRNEVSIMMGVPLKEDASGAKADVGSASYDLLLKGQNAFLKNAAEEGQFVAAIKKRGARLASRIASAKSGAVTDTYSLGGVAQALDRVAKECP